VIAAAIKLGSPRGSIIFCQRRVGHHGCPFLMFKFRTMVADAERQKEALTHLNIHACHGDARMFKFHHDPRVTGVGRVLRRLSLDELPQLVNVLRGEMSLVGPRPLLSEEDANVVGAARARLDVRPGITGPWQAGGRNRVSFGEMLALDADYVAHVSLRRDVGLLLRTLPAVARGDKSS
jgi:lipopolysaccharide/colanic/teichoic acid biosynthesis glycosyltransferase